MSGPLAGIRVLDFGIVWAGPHATRMLADQGAEVIKVESAHRMDLMRGPAVPGAAASGCYPERDPGEHPYNRHGYFNERNRNKLGICLDLGMAEGRALALRLAAVSDVVIDNFRAGTMHRLGLGADEIHAVNPGAIVVTMSAFGQDGPWAHHAGYGATIDALSGVVSTTGYADEAMPQNLGINASDPVAGQQACLAICAALLARRRDGRGRTIDMAQLEAATRLMGVPLLQYQLGMDAGPHDNREPGYRYSAVLPCAGDDAWLAVSCRDDAELDRLLRHLGVGDEDAVADATRTCERDALAAALQSQGIAAGPVYAAHETLADGHLADRGFYVDMDHPEAGIRRYIGTPFRWHGRPQEFDYTPAPLLGQHTDQVLRDILHLSDAELATLRATGVTADDPRP